MHILWLFTLGYTNKYIIVKKDLMDKKGKCTMALWIFKLSFSSLADRAVHHYTTRSSLTILCFKVHLTARIQTTFSHIRVDVQASSLPINK